MILFYIARFPDDLDLIYAAHPKLRTLTETPANSQRVLKSTDEEVRPNLKRKLDMSTQPDDDSSNEEDTFRCKKGKRVKAKKALSINMKR